MSDWTIAAVAPAPAGLLAKYEQRENDKVTDLWYEEVVAFGQVAFSGTIGSSRYPPMAHMQWCALVMRTGMLYPAQFLPHFETVCRLPAITYNAGPPSIPLGDFNE